MTNPASLIVQSFRQASPSVALIGNTLCGAVRNPLFRGAVGAVKVSGPSYERETVDITTEGGEVVTLWCDTVSGRCNY